LVSFNECNRSDSFEWFLIENTLGALGAKAYVVSIFFTTLITYYSSGNVDLIIGTSTKLGTTFQNKMLNPFYKVGPTREKCKFSRTKVESCPLSKVCCRPHLANLVSLIANMNSTFEKKIMHKK